MVNRNRHKLLYFLLSLAAVCFFLADLTYGAVRIPLHEVVTILTGGVATKESWHYIILDYRLPKAITAVLAGTGLAVSGLLMQTFFRNPLAGPYVLGLSSGSSLGVALVVLGAGFLPGFMGAFLLSSYAIVLASCAGSLLVLLAVLAVAQRLRDTMAILVVGLMFGSFTGAATGILTYFSTAEQLQKFTFWSLGSLGNLSWLSISILAAVVVVGLFIATLNIKALNALLLGENYARSMGLNLKKTTFSLILCVSLLAGGITAFAGPIAFVGLAVPHMARLLFRSGNHKTLFTGTLLFGACILLICDCCCQLPGDITLPINAITSIIGAPVVIWLLLRKQKNII